MTEDKFDTDSQKLEEVLAELKKYKPKIFLNFGSDTSEAANKILADLQRRKIDVKTLADIVKMGSGDRDAIASTLKKEFDFVLDMSMFSKLEDVHHKIRSASKSLQLELPEGKRRHIYLAPDSQLAAQKEREQSETFFTWDTDTARLQVVLEMLHRFEGQKPKISHWEEVLGERADLLQKPYALIPLANCVDNTHKEILGEYSYLVLVDNRLGEKTGDTYHLASEVFHLSAHDGKISVSCSGCASDREAIKIPNTSTGRPNGMIVVASHNCEFCGNVFAVSFDTSAKLQKLLDIRDEEKK